MNFRLLKCAGSPTDIVEYFTQAEKLNSGAFPLVSLVNIDTFVIIENAGSDQDSASIRSLNNAADDSLAAVIQKQRGQ